MSDIIALITAIIVTSALLSLPAAIIYGIIRFNIRSDKYDAAHKKWDIGLTKHAKGEINQGELDKLKFEMDKYVDPMG